MPIALAPALIASAAIGAGGSIAGGLIGAHGAHRAAALQAQAAQQGIGQIQQAEQQARAAQQPLQAFARPGAQAMANLASLTAPGGALVRGYGQTFAAPTAAQAAATPGYQFQLSQGLQALQRSAAAQGNLLSGSTLTGIENYAQGLASTDYQNTYNRALQTYGTNYNVWAANQANAFNRMFGVGQAGQQAAGLAAQLGTQTAMGGAADIANLLGARGAAQASGVVGAANAYGGMAGGIANAVSEPLMLNYFNRQGQGGGVTMNQLPSFTPVDTSGFNPVTGINANLANLSSYGPPMSANPFA